MPNKSRDTEYENNCIQITEDNSKQQCSRITAQPAESRKSEQRSTGLRQTENSKDSTGLWWRCCVKLFRSDRMTGNSCWRQCCRHTGLQSRNRPGSHRTGSHSDAKCACRSILEHRCRNRREISERWPVKSLMTWSSAKQITGCNHRRAQNRYNERTVEKT